MIIKVLGPEILIATANTVADAKLVRVVNLGATASLNIGAVGNVSITNTQPIIISKLPTETLQGANMVAAPVAYRG